MRNNKIKETWTVVIQTGSGFIPIYGHGDSSEYTDRMQGFEAYNVWISPNTPIPIIDALVYRQTIQGGTMYYMDNLSHPVDIEGVLKKGKQ